MITRVFVQVLAGFPANRSFPAVDPVRALMTQDGLSAVRDEATAFATVHPDIEVVEYLLADTNGVIRGKWGPLKGLGKAYDGGIPLPYSTFGFDVWGREVDETGLHIETGDKDGMCFAVPGTLVPVPWASRPSAQVLMRMAELDGTPFFVDPRTVLEGVLAQFAERGLTPVVAFELEFYLLDSDHKDGPAAVTHKALGPDRQQMYSIAELTTHEPLFAEITATARVQGLPIDTFISEAGPGQFEVNLLHRPDAVRAADDALMLRRMISGCAAKHGTPATFMAKPFAGWPGNGMHMHVSLLDDEGRNVFADGQTGERKLGNAVAGCLDTMSDALVLFVNTFNGFRRLAPNSYAPTCACWASDNRSVAVRVPVAKPDARRLEHRISGADAHPHLALAGVLAGMLHGLDQELAPPPPIEGSAYDNPDAGPRMTDDMAIATDAFASSDVMANAVGAEFRRIFAELKKAERLVFAERITRLEHETYL